MPQKQQKDSEKKNVGGRPKKNLDVPTKESVMKLAAIGASISEIADFHGCSVDTIRRRYKNELTKGKATMKQRLRKAQLDTALSGNPTLLIWLGKQYLNQTDNGTFEEDLLLDDVDFELDDGSD